MTRTRLVRILFLSAIVLTLGVAGLYVWARAVLAGDAVRAAVASQLSAALGQPVAIGGLGVSVFPRVTMDLADVAIGDPVRIRIRRLHVGTPLGALLSRRIEHAGVRLDGAHVELPLPPLGASRPAATDRGGLPVTLVSIDEIAVRDVTIASGGRTVRGEAALRLAGSTIAIERLSFGAAGTRFTVTGEITDLTGPVGRLTLGAGALNVPDLAAFLADFSRGAGAGAGPGAAGAGRMRLAVAIQADRASFGTLGVSGLRGQARVTPDAVVIDPIHFQLFEGACDGALTLTLARVPAFRVSARVAGLDVGAAMAFAGHPGTITGRAAAMLELAGRGTTADRVLDSATGKARFDVTDGTVARLGLVRTVVVATSMRASPREAAPAAPSGEAFSRLGATFAVASGLARTEDLRFESPDVQLSASGAVRLDGRAVDLAGPLQLSDALSRQAGRDLVRYTQQDGRVTVPITVEGPIDDLRVRVGIADMAKRALVNRAGEEIKKSILKGLGRIIK